MTLKSEDALAAFRDYLDAAPGLPSVKRNDVALEGFEESGAAGIRWKFSMADDDILVIRTVMGDPPEWELAVPASLILAVEGMPGPERDTVLKSAIEALSSALFPSGAPLAIVGKFEDLRLDDRVGRGHILPDPAGSLPIEIVQVDAQLILTAPTPFG
jgi:hypothetical protein